MNVYDTVEARNLEPGDYIVVNDEVIEVVEVQDHGDGFIILGDSVDWNERIVCAFGPFAEFDLVDLSDD